MTAKTKINKSDQLRRLQAKHADSRPGKRIRTSFDSGSQFQSTNVTKTAYRAAFRQFYGFFFLMMSLLMIWVAYRSFVRMPIWFDEGIAKAVVFGLPVLFLTARSRFMAQNIGLDPSKLFVGLNMGTAVGGIYGFAAVLSQVAAGREVVAGAFFLTDTFVYWAGLALLTAWWESLFFFGMPVQYLRSVAGWLSDWWIGAFVTVFFLLFHAPLRFVLAGNSPDFIAQMAILSLFVLGQFVLYTRTRNLYALVLSHFFWGLVIQVYSQTL